MTYKYDNNIECIEINFTLIEDNDFNVNLKPLFINQNGNIFYSGNDHSYNDISRYIYYCLCQLLEGVYLSECKQSLVCESIKKRKILKYDVNVLNVHNLRSHFNLGSVQYTESFDRLKPTKDTFILCNLILEFQSIIDRKMNILEESNKILLCLSLFELFGIKTSDLNINPITKVPFCDNVKYENSFDLWKNRFKQINVDFLVQYIGFDKLESQISKTITTSQFDCYEKYFNYILMGYNIEQLPKITYDKESNSFKYIYYLDYNSSRENEIKEEIDLIKKSVPVKQRYKYFL